MAVTSGDTAAATVSPASLSFSTTWGTPQTVTVTGVNDDVDNTDEKRTATITLDPSSADPKYNALANKTGTANVNYDDTAALTVSKRSMSVDENGGTDTFTVKLATKPMANVNVVLSSSDRNAATVSTGTVSTQLLTFTTSNWNAAQAVTVTGVDDSVTNHPNRTAGISLNPISEGNNGDTKYNALPNSSVAVTALDNDPRLILGASSLTLGEAGAAKTLSVKLASQPDQTVTVTPSTSSSSDFTVSAALTFSTSNWSTAQNITIMGVNDDVDNPNDKRTATLTLDTDSSSGNYASIPDWTVSVTLTDDDTESLVVTGLSLTALAVAENAGTDTFTVKLGSQPVAGSVTVAVSSRDTTAATITRPRLPSRAAAPASGTRRRPSP